MPSETCAADLAALEREAAGERRARRRVRHHHARRRRWARRTRPAVWPAPKSTSTSDSLSASGCVVDLEHLRRDDAGDLLARLLDALDLEAELVQRRDDVGAPARRPA